MHQQIRGSPGDTASNIRSVVNALAKRGINVEAIAPDFDPPHVRVLVDHLDPYDPRNADDPFNQALDAMDEAGLAPEVRSAVMVRMPNQPRALKAAIDRLVREGYVVESILVLPGEPGPGLANVSFGIREAGIAGWDDDRAEELEAVIEGDLEELEGSAP
jgi:hypothetical protein